MKEHEFISPPAETGGENQKKENHLWFKQKNEHHTMSEEDRKGEIMKKFKKIFAALAASALVASMSFTSMAASITINSTAAEGTTDNTSYTYYQILKADILYDADNNIQSVSYYVESEELADQIRKTGLFTVTKSADGSRWIVEATGTSISAADIIKKFDDDKILNKAIATGTFNQAKVTEGETSTVKAVADELSDGYYLIKSSLGTVLAVQTTGEKGVTINEKNDYPSLEKTEDKETASYGEIITYAVNVNIPAYAAKEEIKVVDIMSEGLTPFDGEDADELIDVTAKVGTTELTGENAVTVSQDNNRIEILIPGAAVAANKGQTVTLTYQAVLNNKAVTNIAETNTAHLEYAHYTSIESQVEVKAYDFVLKKVDGADQFIPENAGDAEFTLWDAETGGNQIPVSLKGDGTNTYRVLTGAEKETKIYAGGSVNKHSATIEGLAAGKTYYLQEDKAPKGYNKLTERMALTVEAGEAGVNKANVQNVAGIQLPSTGGMGTVAFAVVGLIVMAGAAITLIIKKRA
ncbi:isopeptide-forming domain-containing fimbrial protein [Oribacterium sp. Sow4_G1_1]|uniref:isopeptide-forming domain-containing fimbrial protein n=1 Tax=Oribacterium sp. Sow4_G1_1 TaxID=3438794 RepID=UPI003F99AC74